MFGCRKINILDLEAKVSPYYKLYHLASGTFANLCGRQIFRHHGDKPPSIIDEWPHVDIRA